MNYRTSDDGSSFEYHMVIRASGSMSTACLAKALRELEQVREFHILPTGD
ncbi:MAG TPA: hypothetical protein VHK27_11400 [Gammaproteobacteria bacterium]|nr:hypothetical protein [Gammaproteobacteria bacterium]